MYEFLFCTSSMKRQFQRGKYFCWEIYLNNKFYFLIFIFDINILNNNLK
jgi:hypothetical protein